MRHCYAAAGVPPGLCAVRHQQPASGNEPVLYPQRLEWQCMILSDKTAVDVWIR
jgi:hypothetical protein